jgi:hypothetical protein
MDGMNAGRSGTPGYGDILAGNMRAERSRKRLGQASVVARMRALGYDRWHRQTMGKVERGERAHGGTRQRAAGKGQDHPGLCPPHERRDGPLAGRSALFRPGRAGQLRASSGQAASEDQGRRRLTYARART